MTQHPDATIATRVAVIRREPNGVIRGTYTGMAETVADAAMNMDAVRQLSPSQPAMLLIDSRALTTMTVAVRTYYSSAATATALQALAILIGSPLSRFFGNVFLGLQQQRVPTRLLPTRSWPYAGLSASGIRARKQRGGAHPGFAEIA